MVKIAIAGGAGQMAQEIIDVLAAKGKHEIITLARSTVPASDPRPGVSWAKVDYENEAELVTVLQGVETVLSFIVAGGDPEGVAQKNLIDASIKAGVKRFAPSEWSVNRIDNLPWYASKGIIRDYLKEVNKNGKVLEYSLFQPGWLLNYLTSPYQSCKHINAVEMNIDYLNCRAILVDGRDDVVTLTSMQDIAEVVARAIEYEGEWPVNGGISGNEIAMSRIIQLGEEVRGGKFAIERVDLDDLEKRDWKASWCPVLRHPSIPPEEVEVMSRIGTAGIMASMSKGFWTASREWNALLPDYKFISVEEFVKEHWANKP